MDYCLNPLKTIPRYTLADAARWLAVPRSTVIRWTRPGSGGDPPLVPRASASTRSGDPVLTFLGLADAAVLAAFHHAGVAVGRAGPAFRAAAAHLAVPHALASARFRTDGAALFDALATDPAGPPGVRRAARRLIVRRHGRPAFPAAVEAFWSAVRWDADGYPQAIPLPAYHPLRIVADPARGFGQPLWDAYGVRVDVLLDRVQAGDALAGVAADYGVPPAALAVLMTRAPAPPRARS